jgi:hypothetical protein
MIAKNYKILNGHVLTKFQGHCKWEICREATSLVLISMYVTYICTYIRLIAVPCNLRMLVKDCEEEDVTTKKSKYSLQKTDRNGLYVQIYLCMYVHVQVCKRLKRRCYHIKARFVYRLSTGNWSAF